MQTQLCILGYKTAGPVLSPLEKELSFPIELILNTFQYFLDVP